jgi:hypothetical protein
MNKILLAAMIAAISGCGGGDDEQDSFEAKAFVDMAAICATHQATVVHWEWRHSSLDRGWLVHCLDTNQVTWVYMTPWRDAQ